jgi:hypothetical protein
MNKLDPHTLFSLFEQGDEEVYKEHGVEDTLKNPYVLLNMVSRGMENYAVMDMIYMKNNYKNYDKVRSNVKYKYFTKLFGYLERLDLEDIKAAKFVIGESYDLSTLVHNLDLLRKYFEEFELYERCLVIKNTIDSILSTTIHQKYRKKLLI